MAGAWADTDCVTASGVPLLPQRQIQGKKEREESQLSAEKEGEREA